MAITNLLDIDNETQPVLTNTGDGYSLQLVRSGTGNATIAPLHLTPAANASAAAVHLSVGGYASITSTVLTTVANTDYAIRVSIGGVFRWIPCFKDAGIIGAAAVA